jgi:hypothetical protein
MSEEHPRQVTPEAPPPAEPSEDRVTAPPPEPAAAEPDADAGADPGAEQPRVGPRILGVAPEPKPLPVVKAKLDLRPPKPPREPLPWPELREAVASVKDGMDVNELKELFRLIPTEVRDEVVEGVRGFRKGARRPVSAFAAKSLARSVHTARRMRRNAEPSAAVSEALGQAMAAELIAGLEVEQAAEVILPKRDLLDREARTARRRAKEEEDRAKDEQRRKRREDAKSITQTSFGEFSGPKIKGLEQLAGLFPDEAPAPDPAAEVPQPVTPDVPTAPAEPPAPVTPPSPEIVPEPATPEVEPQEPPAPEVDPAPVEPQEPVVPDETPDQTPDETPPDQAA